MSQWFSDRPERRNYHRIPVKLDVDLVINGQKMNATASNISCGGLFLPLPSKSVEKHTAPVEVMLTLPDHKRPVKVIGEISRLHETKQSKEQPGLAIKFKGLYDDNILAIERFIKSRMH